MWSPTEVLQVREWLKRGRLRQAARLLLQFREPLHRDVVELRDRVAAALWSSAREKAEQGERWNALDDAQLAARLVEPEGGDAAFLRRLADDVERERAQSEGARKLLEQAERWCTEGRYSDAVALIENFLSRASVEPQSALREQLEALLSAARITERTIRKIRDSIRQLAEAGDTDAAWRMCREAIEKYGPAEELIIEQARVGRLCYGHWIRLAESYLQRGEPEPAMHALQQAREIQRTIELSDDGWLARLQRQLESSFPQYARAYTLDPTAPPSSFAGVRGGQATGPQRAACVQSREHVFLLDERWLVVSADDVTIGHRNSPTAHLRLAARIGREHAHIRRHGSRYHLFFSPGSRPVFVNDQPAQSGQSLQHRDRIRFAGGQGTWHFTLPTRGSATAVLWLDDPGGSTIAVRNAHMRCRGAILMADELVCDRRPSEESHIYIKKLPGRLTLRWTSDGLIWICSGCIARENEDDPGFDEGRVMVPSTLLLRCEVSEFEWLQEVLQHGNDIDQPVSIRFDVAY